MKQGQIKNNQKGVTLMETIVALGILILGIVTSLSLMVSTLSFSQASEKMVVVVNLAREGLELVRSIRSYDGFEALNSGDYIINVAEDGTLSLSGVSVGSGGIVSCGGCQLYLNNSRYTHNPSSTLSDYKRLITVSGTGDEKKVVSQIYWSERGRGHNFILETHLTNW